MDVSVTPTRSSLTLIQPNANRYARYRLSKFERWQKNLLTPNLCNYRDYLLAEGLGTQTVTNQLSSIRAAYRTLLRNRNLFFHFAPQELKQLSDKKAWVDELIQRIENAIHPDETKVNVVKHQDVTDGRNLRLTVEQANRLMNAPGLDTLSGLRNTAIIALMLCTGIRENELCHIGVEDLRQRFGSELALHVRQGKGWKERLVPYGPMEWVLILIDAWLRSARISEGAVFRGIYKSERKLRPNRISVRAIQYIIGKYKLLIDGELVKVAPHDLRRTYARRLYDADVKVEAIQQNMGHVDSSTTLKYIGTLDATYRRPPDVFSFDINRLSLITEMKPE
ncbi:MAG: tyrosine-type recombinase/integrase [Chloroflexota bacterium]